MHGFKLQLQLHIVSLAQLINSWQRVLPNAMHMGHMVNAQYVGGVFISQIYTL